MQSSLLKIISPIQNTKVCLSDRLLKKTHFPAPAGQYISDREINMDLSAKQRLSKTTENRGQPQSNKSSGKFRQDADIDPISGEN